jgi:hypothetical protein
LALKLIARSMRRQHLVIVGTLRDPHPTDAVMNDIRREATVLKLGALPLEAVVELAASRGVSAEGAAVALRLSGGNALFAREILEDQGSRAALAEGRDPPIPHGVHAVLARHVAALPAEVKDTVEWAAVAGDPIDAPLLATASGGDVNAHLDVARKNGLLTGERFAHDLIRAAVYDSIAASDRAAKHRALARALQPRPASAGRVAHHLYLADPTGEETARAAREAAREAIAALAYEEAVVFAERAVAVEERAGRKGALADALTSLAEARMMAGDGRGSTEAAERAIVFAREQDDARIFARAALALGLRRVMGLANMTLVSQLDEAIRRLGDADEVALRCALEARLASALQPGVDPRRAMIAARRSIARARESGDRALLARTLHAARPAFRLLEPLEERYSMDRELLELAEGLGDKHLAAYARGRLFWDAVESGDPLSAEVALTAYERLASELRVAQHELGAASARVVRFAMSGRWDEASALLDMLERDRDRWSNATTGILTIDPVFIMRMVMGPPDAERVTHFMDGIPPVIRPVLEAWTLARGGRLDDARVLLRSAGRFLEGDADLISMVVRSSLSDVSIRVREPAYAPRLYELLLPYAGQHLVGIPLPFYDGSIDRLLGGLSALAGERARAERHYESAIAQEEAMLARPFVERTRKERELLLGTPAPKPVSTRAKPELAHEGETWVLRFGSEEVRLKDSDGLHYIAHLLAHPDVPVPVTELFSARSGEAPRTGDAGEVLDRDAIAAYRARARDLKEMEGDPSAARELAFIEDELKSALGLGGRARRAASEVERIRVNVTTRIRKTIERVRERAPLLAHHLATTIRTGTICTYLPRRSSSHTTPRSRTTGPAPIPVSPAAPYRGTCCHRASRRRSSRRSTSDSTACV